MAEGPENAADQKNELSSTKEDTSDSKQAFENDKQEEETLQAVIELDHHPDCPVCLQPAFYPVKLPCGHIFCFLCIKGVALRSRKCAICRQVIAVDYLEKPTLVKVSLSASSTLVKLAQETEEANCVWYYEGRNGWWQYDDKTSKEVETAFKSGKRSCTLLIAGFLYLIDFENMFQMRRNEPGRRRRIKRDKPDADRKGVAGIRLRVAAVVANETTSKLSSPGECNHQNGPSQNATSIERPYRGSQVSATGEIANTDSAQASGNKGPVQENPVSEVQSSSTVSRTSTTDEQVDKFAASVHVAEGSQE